MLLAYTGVHGEALTDMKLRFGALAPESPQANGGVEASDSFYTPQTQGVPDDPGVSTRLITAPPWMLPCVVTRRPVTVCRTTKS
jgi:hypothetical protein